MFHPVPSEQGSLLSWLSLAWPYGGVEAEGEGGGGGGGDDGVRVMIGG